MRSPMPSFARWTVVLTVIGALSFAALQYWDSTQPGVLGQGYTETEFGPLGPADRDLLIMVRQAGLWEIPTGQQAEQQGGSARVREVGRLLAEEHAELDQRVRQVAGQLGVVLPNQPSDQQQRWMNEIALSAQNGADFDRTFVQRLREAHGGVLPVIAEVRSGTKNEVIRLFADDAAEFVTRHHEYLESTGLVDFSALPDPALPDAPPSVSSEPDASSPDAGVPFVDHSRHISPVANASAPGGSNGLVAGVVYVAAILATAGLVFLLGSAGFQARQGGARQGGARQAGARRQLVTTGPHSIAQGRTAPRSEEVSPRRDVPERPDLTPRLDVSPGPDVFQREGVTERRVIPDRRGAQWRETAPRRRVPARHGAPSRRGVSERRGADRPRHAAQPW